MPDKMLRTYSGAVAVVTGAASGIGRCIAEELTRRGSEVILADLQAELAEEIAAAIRGAGNKAQALKLDVTDASAVDALLRNVIERTGRLDYLFNNAGILIRGPIRMQTLEDWDRILSVNFRGVINGVHSAYPMLRQGFGHIVNTASVVGLLPASGMVAYSATKHAVVGLSISLRAEAAASGIRVSALCPGVVRTPMLLAGGEYEKRYMEATAEQKRKMMEQHKQMLPEKFARKALDAVAKNAAIIVIPRWCKFLWFVNRLSPALSILFMQKMIASNMFKEVAADRP